MSEEASIIQRFKERRNLTRASTFLGVGAFKLPVHFLNTGKDLAHSL